MRIREPVVSGTYYPSDPQQCRSRIVELARQARFDDRSGEDRIGGLVPHAEWVHGGCEAATVFTTLASSRPDGVVVLLGSVHRFRGREAALFASGEWDTPLGPVQIDDRLADRILGQTNLIVDDPYAHEDEHSLEVQLPFVKHFWPQSKIVPLMVPAVKHAVEVGQAVARTLNAYRYKAVVIGTVDWSHDSAQTPFAPPGAVPDAPRLADSATGRRFLNLVRTLKSDAVLTEAAGGRLAGSGGALAATLAACSALGATRGILVNRPADAEAACTSSSDASDSPGVVFV